MTTTIDLADVELVIERLIAKLQQPIQVPISVARWDVKTCASFMRVSESRFRQNYASREDFPKPARLPYKGGRGQPIYKAQEVIDWVDKWEGT